MAKYVLCPRCELNYMQEGEQYCDVCKAELKLGPQLIFTEDDEEAASEKLCPICKRSYISTEEEMCEQCREEHRYANEPDEVDLEKDDEWRNYLDDDEKDMPEDTSDGVISFSQLADEERDDELFRDDDEDEDDMYDINDEPDDFNYDVDEKDFEETDEDEDDEDDDEDEDDDF